MSLIKDVENYLAVEAGTYYEADKVDRLLGKAYVRLKELTANAGFYKCCLLSGETYSEREEPHPNIADEER